MVKSLLSIALFFGFSFVAFTEISKVYNDVHNENIKLSQNYPNLYDADYPTKPTTFIKECVGTTGYVSIFMIAAGIFLFIIFVIVSGIAKFITYILY